MYGWTDLPRKYSGLNTVALELRANNRRADSSPPRHWPRNKELSESACLAFAWLDLPRLLRQCLMQMKLISAPPAVRPVDEFSQLAHHGDKIIVTRERAPCVMPSAAV